MEQMKDYLQKEFLKMKDFKKGRRKMKKGHLWSNIYNEEKENLWGKFVR